MSARATGKFHFRLFVAGDSPNSVQAVTNLRALCATHLPELHEIEIVDLICTPERALAENILLTPTLLKLAPEPVRKIIGNLSDAATLLQTLDLDAVQQPQ